MTPLTDRHHRSKCSRLARVLMFAIALTATAPHVARAGLNAWTTSGPPGPGVNALVSGIAGFPPFYPPCGAEPSALRGRDAQANQGYLLSVVYAGTAGDGVFRSFDHGETWEPVNDGLDAPYIESLLIDQLNATIVYAASPNQGVFKSVDTGAHWEAKNAGLPGPSAHKFALEPSSGMLYVSANDGLFKSCDGGESWEPTALRTRGSGEESGDLSLHAWIDCLEVDPATGTLYA